MFSFLNNLNKTKSQSPPTLPPINFSVGIIGLGFVGGAMQRYFKKLSAGPNTSYRLDVYAYDKFNMIRCKHTLEQCVTHSSILFLCLPTQFNEEKNEYDKSAIFEICSYLQLRKYKGEVVIKSTIEPRTIEQVLSPIYPNLKFYHNPEFLSAATADNDFATQDHIVIGSLSQSSTPAVYLLYRTLFPKATVSICSTTESESMKIYLNCFYATKVQFFNEIYSLCQKTNCNYDVVRKLMLRNNWINPMHTIVPGTDGKLSYGGYCFPKDTNALLHVMRRNNSVHKVLEAVINERNEMRDDHVNVIALNDDDVKETTNNAQVSEQIEAQEEEQVVVQEEEQVVVQEEEQVEVQEEEQVETQEEEHVELQAEKQVEVQEEEQVELQAEKQVEVQEEEQVEVQEEEHVEVQEEQQVESQEEEQVKVQEEEQV